MAEINAKSTTLVVRCLILSSILVSVWGQNLRRTLKTMGRSSKLMKMYRGSQTGWYPAMYRKYRPPAYMTWSMNVFRSPTQKSSKDMMRAPLWMGKGKGKGITSKGTTSNMNWSKGNGKGYGARRGKGKGKGFVGRSSKSGMDMTGMDKKRYYPPPVYKPDCSVCSSDCISVTQVFLVDSTNNVRLFPIEQGEFLDIEFLESFFGVSEFSIECAAEGPIGSMVMADNFGTQIIDNVAPFILAGDNMGDYFDSNFQERRGNWAVTCQPFCQDNAMGESGPQQTIRFEIGPTGFPPSPTPPVPTPPAPLTPMPVPVPATQPPTPSDCSTCQEGCIDVVDFVLVDAATNTRIRSIVPGETIDVGPDDQFTVECITTPAPFVGSPFPVGSTILTDNYENTNGNPEGNPPYSLADDNNGDYNPSGFFENPGPWDVSCTAFCGPNGTGSSSPTRSIDFEINAVGVPDMTPVAAPTSRPVSEPDLDCSTCQEGCIFVTGWNLVDATTDTVIGPIQSGDVLRVSDTDQWTIECLTDPEPFSATPFQIGSTLLTDNYENSRNSENNPPFVLADDNNGDYFASSFFENPGEWIVTCQAFCGRNQQGDASNLETLTFTVERVI